MQRRRRVGMAAIALGVGFNIPYALLASLYDYPAILRQPAPIALQRFADGGPAIILAWYGFALAALALVPLAFWLSVTPGRMRHSPALAIGAAISGSLAGLAQAIGLSRWVFVVPGLAATPNSPDAARMFDMLNAFGGVAIGEHLGQLLTASFVLHVAALQRSEGAPRLALLGGLTALAITLGTGEGLAIALGGGGAAFSTATILGFLGLSGWLVVTGSMLARADAPRTMPAA